MAITVTERFTGRSLGTQADQRGLVTTTATRVFDATTTAGEDEISVLLHASIPKANISFHPARPWLRCKGSTAAKMQPGRYEVSSQYAAPVNAGSGSEDPLQEPPDVDWDTVDSEEPIDEDINGDPIATVLGEPFEPHLTITTGDLLLRITRNLASFDVGIIADYMKRRAVNSDTVFGFLPPGTVRVNKLRAKEVLIEGGGYFRVGGEFQFRRGAPETTDDKAFWRRVKAQGFYYALDEEELYGVGDPGTMLVARAQENGEPTTKPVHHYVADGRPVPRNSLGVFETCEWYEFEVHPSLPFAALGLLS